MSEGARHIVCPHCNSVNRIPNGKRRSQGEMRPMPPGSLQRAAGRSLGQKLRKPHPAKRHPGGGRLLGAVVRAVQSHGADL
jgi:hypothetical protein